jgi:hypothetical protein
MVGAAHPLVSRFAAAGLALRFGRPRFVLDGRASFHLTIERLRRAPPAFLMWTGASSNRIVVLDAERRLSQVLLLVQEPSRWVTVRIPKASDPPARGPDVRVIARDRSGWTIAQRPPGGKRRFLVGRDERDLFIAQIPSACSTVRAAHAALRPIEATLAAHRVRTVRQGEWFFLDPTPREALELAAALSRGAVFVRAATDIGAAVVGRARIAGNPHTADELVVVPGAGGTRSVFVRGRVRHRDHATVRFHSWRRVLRNNEPSAAVTGVSWVD